MTGAHEQLLIKRGLRGQRGRKGLIADFRKSGRLAGRAMTRCRNGKQRLAHMFDHISGQNRIARKDRPDVGMAGHVLDGHDRNHAGVGPNLAEIHGGDTGVGVCTLADGRVQEFCGLGEVVYIAGLSTNVLPGTVMKCLGACQPFRRCGGPRNIGR